ncbi:MAG: retropepsin-like aspartic protease [Myxococcota bacterium]
MGRRRARRPEPPQPISLPESPSPQVLPDLVAADETLPLRRAGEHLLVVAHLESRHGANDLPLVLDTGAAITTLTRRGADVVELELSDESPVVALNGVGGRSEALLAVVDTLWLGDQAVGPLTVAVCDACLPGHGEGLLGIDVLSHFASEIDGDGLRLALRRSSRAPPRDLVTPFLRVAARLRIQRRGEVRGEIEVRNLAPVDVGDVRLTIECPHETFEFALAHLAADEDERVDVALPWGTECPEFRAAVVSAHWR